MEKRYLKYTINELLSDDYFISSVLHPTAESQEFWEYQIQNECVTSEDFEQASLFVRAVQSPKEKMFRKEKDMLWEKIEIANKKHLRKKIRNLYIISISAACIFFLLGGVAFHLLEYESDKKEFDPMALLRNTPKVEDNSNICLVSSGNEQMSFEENHADIKYNEKGEVEVNSQTLAKEKQSSPTPKERSDNEETKTQDVAPVYNQLIVPKGKHSTLLLSDGTKLWVNAGSHVVFPNVFAKDHREIYVDGEVYLEVARNESCPFIVKTEQIQVQVLGTSFNVKSYNGDSKADVVLVNGSVQVRTKTGRETKLVPNQRCTCVSDGKVNVETVDVYDYISWKDGLLQYNSEKLSVILKRLSDYYGKEIQWDEEVGNLKCSGKLDLKENIEKILNGLTKMMPVEYTKRENSYCFSMNP